MVAKYPPYFRPQIHCTPTNMLKATSAYHPIRQCPEIIDVTLCFYTYVFFLKNRI